MENLGSRDLEGVVCGSFKFKPEIDAAINEFRDLNVIIRAPEIGWLYVPKNGLVVANNAEQFQPLPSEQHMLAGQVEAGFLAQLDQADFVYIMNSENYLGSMSVFETGYSRGAKKPIYSSNPLDFQALGIHDPKMIGLLQSTIPVMSPSEAARDMRSKLAFADIPTPSANLLSTIGTSSKRSSHDSLLPLSSRQIAEGAILRFGKRVMLVADGRWHEDKLTIPGKRVRFGEKRTETLQRLIETKVGTTKVESMSHFATNFMIPDSGYNGFIDDDTFIFDDHIIDVGSDRIQPKIGVSPNWVLNSEIEDLIKGEQVEPNAAILLASYLRTAAL